MSNQLQQSYWNSDWLMHMQKNHRWTQSLFSEIYSIPAKSLISHCRTLYGLFQREHLCLSHFPRAMFLWCHPPWTTYQISSDCAAQIAQFTFHYLQCWSSTVIGYQAISPFVETLFNPSYWDFWISQRIISPELNLLN